MPMSSSFAERIQPGLPRIAEEFGTPFHIYNETGIRQNAQKLLLTSDAEWDRIRPLMRVTTDAEFTVMRERYREGLLHTWSARDRQAAARLFHVLADVGGEELVGQGVHFDPKAFWDGLVF